MQATVLIALRTAVVAAAILAGSARAADAPLVIAGGPLDPAFTGADIYQRMPEPARTASGKACQAAQAYVDLINAGRFEKVADLFESDGVAMDPARNTARGRAAVHAFYDEHIRKMAPQIIAVALVGDDRDCMLEIAARQTVRGTERYALVSVDHFTLGDSGKIARMVAFARPPRRE